MSTSNLATGSTGANGDVFVAGVAGVAALDPPQVTQTKSEIRNIVSEIAELSASAESLDEFLGGMLPRVCTAMGASAAAMWDIDSDQQITLQGSHALPSAIAEQGSSSAVAHERVLACIAAEASPVLVPPGSTRLVAERPTNPLDEALLVVPIKIHDRVDTLLEVIQPPGGGPAAQRGYLRFVAQMADFLADFLRRLKLRELNDQARQVKLLEEHLLAVSTAQTASDRYHRAAKGLARLLNSDMVLLLQKRRRSWCVVAVSELMSFDPRSEIVVKSQQILKKLPPASQQSSLDVLSSSIEPLDSATPATDNLRALLGTDRLLRIKLDQAGHWQAVIALHASVDMTFVRQRGPQFAQSLGALIQLSTVRRTWADGLATARSPDSRAGQGSWTQLIASRWLVRASIAVMATTVALFPLPDQVRVVAVLEAIDRQLYYAPSNATVESIHVDDHQVVQPGTLLMQLVDRDLESRVDQLSSDRSATLAQLEQDRQQLLRGQQLSASVRDELESRMEQLKIKAAALDRQLELLQSQMQRLRLVARKDGIVATWDVRNRLTGRPVPAGGLLLVTSSPDSPWKLQLSIPERQAGRVEAALKASHGGLPVQFSLSSHPEIVLEGQLSNLSTQLVKDADGHANLVGSVTIDGSKLPTHIDGAVARAAIDCGKTCALWLALRDAYREASSWLRMTW